MRQRWIAALAQALSLAPAAYAQESDEGCTALVEAALALQDRFVAEPFKARFAPAMKDCVIKDLTLASIEAKGVNLHIGETSFFSTTGMERLQSGLPPLGLNILANNIRPFWAGETPRISYISRVQAKGMLGSSLHLRYDWLAAEKRFRDFSVFYRPLSGVEASGLLIEADIRGVDLTDWEAIQHSYETARLHKLNIVLWLEGMFETGIMPFVALDLLDDNSPPENQIEALKRAGVEFVAALPQEILDEESGRSLAAMIKTIPHPRGRLTITLTSEQGLAAAPFAALETSKPQEIFKALIPILQSSGSEVAISWDSYEW
jgi:hypothetical protein